jgi:hypothetical protein
MSVSDCNGERVGGIGACDLHSGKEARDHRMDLRLFGCPSSNDGLLHEPRGIFTDRNSGSRSTHQNDAARVSELQRRLRVLVDEDLFGSCSIGSLFGDQELELFGKGCKSVGQRRRAIGTDLAIGNMDEAVSLGVDHAPAGRAEPRVEAQDPQARRSSSSSGTS